MREPEPDADTGDDAEPYWGDRVFGDEPLDIYEVPQRIYAKVHIHDDGSATLDEGWGGAFIETDALLNLEGWR